MAQTIRVNLSWDEVLDAAICGVRRGHYGRASGRSHLYGLPADKIWDADVNGVLGEMAAAKGLDRYWRPRVGEVGPGDLGDLEVRATDRLDGCLILHPKDPDDRPHVLVVGSLREWELRGWLHAGAGKLLQYRRAPNGREPAYFVPQSVLRPMGELVRPAGRPVMA